VAAEETLDPPAEEERESAPIASIREALRSDLLSSETADAVRELLLEALHASKSVYVSCGSCGKRNPAQVPDLAGRVAAATALMDQIEGKLQQAAKSSEDRIAEALAGKRQLQDLTDHELFMLSVAGEVGDPDSDYLTAECVATARRVLDDHARRSEMTS
jgi:transcription elongation factor Elf1